MCLRFCHLAITMYTHAVWEELTLTLTYLTLSVVLDLMLRQTQAATDPLAKHVGLQGNVVRFSYILFSLVVSIAFNVLRLLC